MTAPPEQVAQKVRQWMAFAEEDLLLARHGLGLAERAPLRLIAYHAQQCAEKYLKAFPVWRQVDFPYTHNIALLLELVAMQANWADSLMAAATLTPFAITARYPGARNRSLSAWGRDPPCVTNLQEGLAPLPGISLSTAI